MKTGENTGYTEELMEKKCRIERDISELSELRNQIKQEELKMQYDTVEDLRMLNEMEEMIGCDHKDIRESIENIRCNLRKYEECAYNYREDGFRAFDEKIMKLEDELENVRLHIMKGETRWD